MKLPNAKFLLFLLIFALILGCNQEDSSTDLNESNQTEAYQAEQDQDQAIPVFEQHKQARVIFHELIGETASALKSVTGERDLGTTIKTLDALSERFVVMSEDFGELEPLTVAEMIELHDDFAAESMAVFDQLQQGMDQVRALESPDPALRSSITNLYKSILSVKPPAAKEHKASVSPEEPAQVGKNLVGLTFEANPIPSAFIVIEDAAPTDPQLLVQQLQQVLPKTMVVKQLPSPGTRDVKLEVTNVRDLRALANLIPFGSVDSIDERTRTITVDFDL